MPRDNYTQTLNSIGDFVLELRQKAGYSSHEQFAAKHGIPRVQYWRIEAGRANITMKTLHRIASIHGFTIIEFFHHLDKRNKRP